MGKILVYHERAAKECVRELAKWGITQAVGAQSQAEALAVLEDVEIIFGWNIPQDVFAKAPSLRWVQLMGAGVDDIVLSRQLPPQVILTRIVGQFGLAIAEYVFAYLLYHYKHIELLRAQQQSQIWKKKRLPLLAGKTLAVAGLGSIGEEIIRLGRAFGMRILGLSKTGSKRELVDEHFFDRDWPLFVEQADILVITLPHTSETFHVVNQRVFAAMKSTAVIVNVGRGAVIDEVELIRFLEQNKESMAILDVFETEPLAPEHQFWKMKNVLITPHLSGPSSIAEVSQFFSENFTRYQNGQPLLGTVPHGSEY
ncbi:D-2-hydroxyacid dehydrogenase [Sulfoacidibacillus thermotolerans]|uniref:D-isomer specific 2-hydroxyacid dehydrogenase NAD-binding domain-containing protein n=1 Tax=Sulfoacidibacillus thermotolerans TaxID=1765684 RepID=A0A2U3DB82_SULT2|nr:D-2-hydroxyacid dehydrogenase [Sulfoacidibacillus thermotolerans]PWI58536.1 hypothetical protein BM613_03195 [Sulfoacidibacillus thermotolerans]